MLTDEIARAVQSAPRSRLAELAATIWRAFGAGAIGEADAQALAEAVEARKRIPTVPTQPRRVGSRPRAPESLERRRRWVTSGWVPPTIACRFTAGELSALSVVAAQVAKHGRCDLALDHIAALAGVAPHHRPQTSSARLAGSGFLRSRCDGSGPSATTRTLSASPLRLGSPGSRCAARHRGQGVGAKPCAARAYPYFLRGKERQNSIR